MDAESATSSGSPGLRCSPDPSPWTAGSTADAASPFESATASLAPPANGAGQTEKGATPLIGESLRGAWRGLRTWGDQLERRHFDGDFLATVSSASRQVSERASRLGEELGSAAAKLVEEAQAAQGPGGGEPQAQEAHSSGKRPNGGGSLIPPFQLPQTSQTPWGFSGLSTPQVENDSSTAAPKCSSAKPDTTTAATTATKGASEVTALWEQRERLQRELTEERDRRRGRSLALSALDDASRALRSDLLEARRSLATAEDRRASALRSVDEAERAFEQLTEKHDKLQRRQAQCEVEIRKHGQAVAAAERAERQASREGAWARDGPEMEALKIAKLTLAELLAVIDQAQLDAKKQDFELQLEHDRLQAENAIMRARQETQTQQSGVRGSIGRLLSGVVARRNNNTNNSNNNNNNPSNISITNSSSLGTTVSSRH
mmetsp:Transcript_10715/g.23640  ORF Transcript_10715/g.23640 Transcript_10715/m.23640 type:complete len:433 (-) Transcript_10715:185-1483(-)